MGDRVVSAATGAFRAPGLPDSPGFLPFYLPVWLTRQTDFDPSSVTISDPSDAVATPTGRPQTLPSGRTNPVRKSS